MSRMSKVQVTAASSKGQVVIPQEIRKEVGILAGTRLAVYGKGDTVILKVLKVPEVAEFENLAAFGRQFAKKKGITEKDVTEDD